MLATNVLYGSRSIRCKPKTAGNAANLEDIAPSLVYSEAPHHVPPVKFPIEAVLRITQVVNQLLNGLVVRQCFESIRPERKVSLSAWNASATSSRNRALNNPDRQPGFPSSRDTSRLTTSNPTC
jgi:hypothetical protein